MSSLAECLVRLEWEVFENEVGIENHEDAMTAMNHLKMAIAAKDAEGCIRAVGDFKYKSYKLRHEFKEFME